ncbi:hypothetical protein [Rhizobium grahamii]|uniref:hypothetical protein n=1 Tax=Rhizobium grahamii TaxID=1120045 RepID=UPI001FCADE93|nr:hypothetical protein [Rhizobium grahamii]
MLITVPAGGYVPTFVGRGLSDAKSSDREEQAGTADMGAGKQPGPVETQKSEGRVIRWIMIGAVMIVLAAVIVASLAEWGNPALKTEVRNGGKARIVVDPFQSADHNNTSNDISIGVTGEIILSLSKFSDLIVIAKDVAAGTAADPSYILKGNVRLEGDDMRSTARLVRQVDGVVVWSGDYSVDIKGRSMLDVEAGIGRSIASAVAAPFGARATSGSDRPALSSVGK